jgi:hypothetical protein
MEVVKTNEDGFPEGLPVRCQVPPLSREHGVGDVNDSIDGEEPHKEEVPGHSFCRVLANTEGAIEPFGKKPEERDGTEADSVNIIGPVNPQATPGHQCQQGKIHPVAPSIR